MASKIIAWPFRALIAIYRYCISPFIAGSCRFHPSCSAYADESFQTHNAFKASILTLKRISRCHPWGGSGYDPVPAAIAVNYDDRKGSPERS